MDRTKINKIAIFFLTFLFSIELWAYAEIGKGIDEFKKSEFAKNLSLKLVRSYTVKEPIEYKGKKDWHYESRPAGYFIDLIANPGGKEIVFQSLMLVSDKAETVKDAVGIFAFVEEAVGYAVDSNIISNKINQMAEQADKTKKSQKGQINEYTLEFAIYKSLGAIQITVRK